MCLLFAGSLWLIYSPSEKERAAEEKEKGFNTDIPSPGQQRMDGSKVDAYEREELEKKDKYRKNAFQEMASLFGSSGKDTVYLPEGMAELPVEEADKPATGSHNTVRSSAGACRDMNRTLDNFIPVRRTPKGMNCSGVSKSWSMNGRMKSRCRRLRWKRKWR